MYELFNDFVGTLPLRYQFIVPIMFLVLILMLLIFIYKMLGGK